MEVKEIVLKSKSKTQIKTVLHKDIAKYLKPHQIDGIKFMFENCYEQNSGCILAHCMGLGKTLQVIALLHSVISLQEYSTNKILVLCPISTIINWKEEIVRWLAPINDQRKLQIYELEQKDDINRKISALQKWSLCDNNAPAACLIMGYEAFRNLVNFHSSKANTKKFEGSQLREIRQLIERYLLKSADIVICDEGHIIRNLNAAITLAVNQIRTKIRIILTGTPMQNHLMEYYSMVNFVKPSFLGTKQRFNEYFAEPIKNGQHADSCPTDIKYMKERSYALNKKLSKIVQRREISLLKDFLPEKFEFVLFVPLTDIQYKLYKYFLDHRGGSIEYKRLFGDYTCLRKIWTHLKVLDNAHQKSVVKKKKMANNDGNSCSDDDDDEDQLGGLDSIDNDWWRRVTNKSHLESALSSHKITILFEILKECKRTGDKCVIFSGFVQVLNVIEFFMNQINQQQKDGNLRPGLENFVGPWIKNEDYYRLDGSIPKDRRHSMIKNFNDENNKRIKVFLISAQAGGQGINLFGANRLILLDTSWNPAKDQQSIFRIYRMGQTKHCYIYRLLSMGTMEEKIYSRSVTKQAMSCRVVDKQQIDRHYSMNELYELYSLTKTNMKERPLPILPKDDLLAQLLQKHPDKIYKYLEHDSLLENKVEEELNDVEKNEAWQSLERNSQSQSLHVTSVELHQQILASSSQNPSMGLTVKSQNPSAISGPNTANFLVKDNFSGSKTVMDTSSKNSALSSIDPFVQNEAVQIKKFSEELRRQKAEVDTDLENAPNSFNEPLESNPMNEEFSQEVIGGRELENVLVQNVEVDTDIEIAINSSNEPLKSNAMNEEFSQELIGGQELQDVLVQNAEVGTDVENAPNSFNEPLETNPMNKEFSQEIIGGRELEDVLVQNAEVDTDIEIAINSSNEPLKSNAMNEEFSQEVIGGQELQDVLVQNAEVGTDVENAPNSFNEPLESNPMNKEFSQEIIGGRELEDVLVQNAEVDTDIEIAINSSNEPLKSNAMNEEFSQEVIGGQELQDVLVQNGGVLEDVLFHKTTFPASKTVMDTSSKNLALSSADTFVKNVVEQIEKFSDELVDGRQNYLEIDTNLETATNFYNEPLGSVAMNEEFSQEFIDGRVLEDVLVQNAEFDIYSTNATKSVIEPCDAKDFSEEPILERVFKDILVENSKADTDLEISSNAQIGNDVMHEECLEKLSERQIFIDPPYVWTEKIDASTSTVDLKSSEHIAEQQESLNAEFQKFDKGNVDNRTVNFLSAFAKGLLNTLNNQYGVPLQQREQQSVLSTIDNYSEEGLINCFNRSNNFEFKITFKRPLNSNDQQQPVKKLKLSLEIDPTASVMVDQASSTLPLIINDRSLFEDNTFARSTQSFKNDNLRLENMRRVSIPVNTIDVEPYSKVVERTSKNVVSRQFVESMMTSEAEYSGDQASLPNLVYLHDTMTDITVKEVEIPSCNIQLLKEICPAPNVEQSTTFPMSLRNSSAEDVEMNSNCIEKSSIFEDNINDRPTNYKQLALDPFVDEGIFKQSNVASNEQETLLPCYKRESVSRILCNETTAENSLEDETMLSNRLQRSEGPEEESIDDTVCEFNAFDNFDGEQKSSTDTTHIETPLLRDLSEFETSSEDERDLENCFESSSSEEVHDYEESILSNEQHSILSTMKRTCVLM